MHRLHRFVRLEKGFFLARIFHLMVKRCSLPDGFSKFRVVLARLVFERHLMVSKPSFKFRSSKTYIGWGFAGRRHLGLVNDFFRATVPF